MKNPQAYMDFITGQIKVCVPGTMSIFDGTHCVDGILCRICYARLWRTV
jgi:hypothetical protein